MNKIPRKALQKEGFRFHLKPCSECDGEAIFEAARESYESVSRWMDWLTKEYSVNDSKEWATRMAVEWLEGKSFEFVIMDSADGRVSGCCGLNRINDKDLICNLGYWVRESKCRLGAATQATILLAEFGLNELGLRRIEVVVAVGNLPSQGVALKAGAKFEGVQELRLKVGDVSHDSCVFTFLKDL